MILIVLCSKENGNRKQDAMMIIPTNNESSSQSPVKIIPVCLFTLLCIPTLDRARVAFPLWFQSVFVS